MALILQIFLHSRRQQPEKKKQKQQQHIEATRLHFKRRPQPTRKTQSEVIKRPHRLKQEQNTDTLSL
jgi:hypothetical protein